MINLSNALKNRISNFMRASTTLRIKYTASTNPAYLHVADSTYFNIIWCTRNYPQAILKSITDGTKHRVKIKEIDTVNHILTLDEPIDYDVPVGSTLYRAPNYDWVQNVMIGDPSVIPGYPTICVVANSKANKWQTLLGTQEHQTYSIITHVLMDQFERAETTLQRITEDLEDLLNADLHLAISGRENTTSDSYNRTYNSLIENTEYGYSYKGTQFLRSSKIAWFGEEYWHRYYITEISSSNTSFD